MCSGEHPEPPLDPSLTGQSVKILLNSQADMEVVLVNILFILFSIVRLKIQLFLAFYDHHTNKCFCNELRSA